MVTNATSALDGTQPDSEVSPRRQRWPVELKLGTGFGLALLCLAAAGIAGYLGEQRFRANVYWVEHTHEVLSRLDRLLALVADAETAERGYVITGDEDYVRSYQGAAGTAGRIEQELLELTADNAAQEQRLRQLNDLVGERLARLRTVDETRRLYGFAAAQELIAAGPGKRIHNDLHQQTDALESLERSLLRERQQQLDRSIAVAVLIGVVSSLLALACIVWAGFVSRRDLAERKRLEAEREAFRARLALQLEDMRRLHELSSRLVALGDLPQMLEEILGATIELQHADFGNIQLYDPATDTLRIVAQRGFSREFLDHFRAVGSNDPSVCGRALRNRSRVVVEDVAADAAFAPHRAISASADFRGVQSTPIFGRDDSIKGILSTHFRQPHRPAERDLQMTDLYLRIGAALIEGEQDADAVRLARDEADRANRAKGRFLATASHDLRQPLQALSLLNGTLRRLLTDADAARVVEQQQQAVSVMSGLLNVLLNISKLESGAIQPQIGNCDLGTLFEELRGEFSESAARKGLQLEVVPCPEFARTDRTLLGQILRNLLGNAIRYTRHGSVRLECRRDGERLRIDVADTGIGIAPEHLRDIFEEFYQVAAPGGGVREGHGLGLSIVRRAAQLLNHELRVDSEPGQGSVFSVFLPLGAAEARAPGPATSPDPGAAVSRPTHVLIVDDDLAVLDATRLLLKVEGYRVSAAASFEAALEQARANPDIDLLISDLHLGDGRTGTEVIASIRGILGRLVKTVLITGDTSGGVSVSDIARDDRVRVTSKPVKAEELLGLLHALAGTEA
jgi:two-component system, sensor histidine kinase